ncbi:hypothetical protein DY000_02041685 [Brassica cretica]|uniref:DUF223 domain-containing protein n=1 Tax=Brassica cretica TaxID=69181 RepID=A0ABQ7B933_BRACR|nr:hypothetical protein DY000_02041685 [Brassica cretica]
MAMKRNGKSPVSSDSDEKVVFSNDVSLGPHASQLRFRIIHFWEARNPVKKTLIGMEMLLIEEHGTVVQRFIPLGRIMKYLPDMIRGSVYKLINFYGSKNKPVYRVADHVATVSFTWNSKLTVLHDIPIQFNEDHFRFHSYEDFEANCGLRGDLYGTNAWDLAKLQSLITPEDIPRILNIRPSTTNGQDKIRWNSKEDQKGTLALILGWRIWKMRNKLVFENKRDHIIRVIHAAAMDIRIWTEANAQNEMALQRVSRPAPETIHDVLPHEAQLYCIVDA